MKHVIGKCPHCGGEVVEFPRFYGCANWRKEDGKCPFTLPKKFTGRGIPSFVARELLESRESRKVSGFVSSKGEKFSASLELFWDGNKWKLKMRFE